MIILIGLLATSAPGFTVFEVALHSKNVDKINNEKLDAVLHKPLNINEINYEDIFKKAEEFAFKKHLQFDTQIHEFGKRKDIYRKNSNDL